MRRITVIGMIILGLVALPLMAAAAPPAKVDICHFTGDGESHTIEISEKALQAHLNHGDVEGACDDTVATELPTMSASIEVTDIACETWFFGDICDVTFDASKSVGEIDTFTWAVSQDTVLTTGTGPVFVALALAEGSYQVTLTASGPSGTVTETMTISLP